MNGGVIVVLCIVGALVLCEAVLPRISESLWRWWWDRAKKAIGTQLPSANANQAKTEMMSHGNETVPSRPPRQALTSGENGGTGDASAGRGGRDGTDLAAPGRGGRDSTGFRNYLGGQRRRARAEEDLGSIYAAAKQGRPEAMVRLGEFAYSRGAIVEAFYWTILAELKGAEGLDEALFEMRTRWLAEGCPGEFENAYADFTEEQGEFARALLSLQCDVDPQYASVRLQELADAGNEAAQLFVQIAKEEVGS